jgi:hypothetical protein
MLKVFVIWHLFTCFKISQDEKKVTNIFAYVYILTVRLK